MRNGNAEDGEQRHRLHELAGGDVAGRHPPGAEPEQGDGAEVREGVEAGLEAGPQPADDQPLAAELLGPLPHPRRPRGPRGPSVFTSEGALEALVGHARHVADAGLGGGGRLLDALRVGVVEHGQPGEQRHGDAEEHPVDGGEQHHRHADEQHHAEREREGLHRHRRALAVGVGVGEQLAGGVLVEPPQRHAEVAVGDALEPEHLHPALRHLAEVAAQHHADHPEGRATHEGDGADRRRRCAPRPVRRRPARARRR